MKLWAGRMSGEVDERLNKLNASIGFDSRMYKQDITGSIAHARMLGKTGIIDIEESEKINIALNKPFLLRSHRMIISVVITDIIPAE